MILIGYDGSDNAKDAIERAGALFTGQDQAGCFTSGSMTGSTRRSPDRIVPGVPTCLRSR